MYVLCVEYSITVMLVIFWCGQASKCGLLNSPIFTNLNSPARIHIVSCTGMIKNAFIALLLVNKMSYYVGNGPYVSQRASTAEWFTPAVKRTNYSPALNCCCKNNSWICDHTAAGVYCCKTTTTLWVTRVLLCTLQFTSARTIANFPQKPLRD